MPNAASRTRAVAPAVLARRPLETAGTVPRRSRTLLDLARWWAGREVRRTLDGFHVAGLEVARSAVAAGPTIFASNHVSFWDPFLLLLLDRALETDGHVLMDAENVCRIPLFRRLGGIPIRRGNPRPGLRAAASILTSPGDAVWVFPQGRPRAAHLRPLDLRPGIRLLARMAPHALVVPAGIQYAFRDATGPVCYASFGSPLAATVVASRDGIEALEAGVTDSLTRIDAFLLGSSEPFEALVPSRDLENRPSIPIRLLDRLTRR